MDLSRLWKIVVSFVTAALLLPFVAQAQPYQAVVFFRDKVGSPFTTAQAGSFLTPRSLARRAKFNIPVSERDRPVSATYLANIRQLGVTILKASKWHNAALVTGDSARIAGLASQAFVLGEKQVAFQQPKPDFQSPFSGMASVKSPMATLEDYGQGQSQAHMIGIDSMHAAGYTGKGVMVAVLDAGFENVLQHQAFTRLRDSGYLADIRDFVYTETPDVFHYHWHGGGALSCIGGYYPSHFISGAYQAKFALYVTEDNRSELPVEGFNWTVAAERADSLGVDLISTSLGYTQFDKPMLDYKLSDLDGHTTLISQSVNFATQTGMLCVSSAGNDGLSVAWQGKIGAPGDAELGLTVGAVGPDSVVAAFSSRGFRDRQLKPDVVAQGVTAIFYDPIDPTGVNAGNGTSFSCPLVAGLVAGMMQEFPNLSPAQWIQALHRTSSRANTPDTSYGYGIPNYTRLRNFLRLVTGVKPKDGKLGLYPNPQVLGGVVSFMLDTSERLEHVVVVNALGQVVRIWTPLQANGEFAFSTEGLARGTYVVRAELSGGSRWAKFVVQ